MDEAEAPLYERFNIVSSFLIAAAVVLALGMAVIGLWVSERIEEAASRNAAMVAAHYVDGVVAPLTQTLLDQSTLDDDAKRTLDQRLARGLMNRELFAFKVWSVDGVIAYASNPELIGRRYELTEGLLAAIAGQVFTEYDKLDDAEDYFEQPIDMPLLEIYSPIRNDDTGEVIGVVEFYDAATDLASELRLARLETWLVVALTTIAMLALLSIVILRGNRVISFQRTALRAQIETLSSLLEQNRSLGERVTQANRRAAALNERHLRRISAEIHDGPVQLLAFASLRLSSPRKTLSEDERKPIRQALDEAIAELRQLSSGLTLPELDGLSAIEVARRAVRAHQTRTGTPVSFANDESLPEISQAEKICLYRFIQEGLNNAERHADGKELAVELKRDAGSICVYVRDGGPGFDSATVSQGLGLSGLRERVVGLGGQLTVKSTPGAGTVLQAQLPALSAR